MNMLAERLLDERHILGEAAFAEIAVWRVPVPFRGSNHEYRYRLALRVAAETPKITSSASSEYRLQ